METTTVIIYLYMVVIYEVYGTYLYINIYVCTYIYILCILQTIQIRSKIRGWVQDDFNDDDDDDDHDVEEFLFHFFLSITPIYPISTTTWSEEAEYN